MICSECGKRTKKTKGSVQAQSLLLGEITVPGITRDLCKCGKYWLDMDNARKIAEYVTAHEVGAISSLPVDNFVSRKQACDILGWTVQEFRKNQRVKNGFIIFYATLQGERYYLRESVEMFRDTKDGRFNILTCGQRVTRLQVLAATIQ